MLRLHDFNRGQLCSSARKSIHRNLHTRHNHATKKFLILRNKLRRNRCAHINNDKIFSSVKINRPHSRRNQICTNFLRVRVTQLKAGLNSSLNKERFAVQIFCTGPTQRMINRRHNRAAAYLLNLLPVKTVLAQNRTQKNTDLIRARINICRPTEAQHAFLAVKKPASRRSISNINC